MSDSDGAIVPAEMASQAPTETPTVFRVGGVAVAGGLVVSLVVHMALVGTVLVVSPRLGHPETAIPVDLVTPDEVAAEIKQAQEAKQETKQDTKPETKLTPETPKPQAGPGPGEAALSGISVPLASSALPIDALAPSFDTSPGELAAPSPGPPAGLSQLLGLQSSIGGPGGGPPSEYKADLTATQIAGFGAHVQSCWTAPAAADGPAVTVFVRVSLKRDGTLAGPPEPLGGSASLPAITLLQSALAALQNCPAYKDLPADKYDEWRVLDLRFTPSGISVAVPSAGNQRKPG